MIEVLQAGFYTTIQDKGRFGYLELGVPVSGAMDQYSADMANLILGNDLNSAVIECTIRGPKLKFTTATSIAIYGAEMVPRINDEKIEINKAIIIKPNDVLSFDGLRCGARTYIAIKGGVLSNVALGSRSMYTGITSSRLIKGDQLPISTGTQNKKSNAKLKSSTSLFETNTIEVYKGPEFEKLTTKNKELLLSKTFTVSSLSNRMAYQFNELLKNNLNEIITAPVLPGTVQLTPLGQLIALMRDCQTTGGYPRILQISKSSLNVLAQKNTGKKILFRLEA